MESLEKQVKSIADAVQKHHPGADTTIIDLAFSFARDAHEGQLRKSGEPYITHPLATALTLAQWGLPVNIVVAGILHDVPEDTSVTLEEVKKNFGDDVANLVSGVTKLGKVQYRGADRYLENLRKMFIAMANDPRMMLIKFADRMHNLTTMASLPPEKAQRIALETLEIYAPVANRLGMGEIKGTLEDLAFEFAFPEEYKKTKDIFAAEYEKRKVILERLLVEAEDILKKSHIPYTSIHGRVKHLYSFYCKFKNKEYDIQKIHDLVALRIIVPTVADCYAALGILHSVWAPLKGRIKDYIAQPKPNGYRSLHTTVFAARGEIVEFQIRTTDMHEEAEYGIAAHWHYDESGSLIANQKVEWVQAIVDMQKEFTDHQSYVNAVKLEVFKDRIFVFTPKGDVIDLPAGSTPVDFAYMIHTDIGNQCTGARVNDKLESIDTVLESGDVVEIITDKKRKSPNPDWLEFAHTHNSKKKIKAELKKSKLVHWLNKFVNQKDVKSAYK